jgi:hypothetical protein
MKTILYWLTDIVIFALVAAIVGCIVLASRS